MKQKQRVEVVDEEEEEEKMRVEVVGQSWFLQFSLQLEVWCRLNFKNQFGFPQQFYTVSSVFPVLPCQSPQWRPGTS